MNLLSYLFICVISGLFGRAFLRWAYTHLNKKNENEVPKIDICNILLASLCFGAYLTMFLYKLLANSDVSELVSTGARVAESYLAFRKIVKLHEFKF